MPRAVSPSGDASASLVRADVLVLLREKRYEDALARLYQARTEAPDSVEVQRSIDQVKEFLIGAYAKRLGGLDQVAKPYAPVTARSPDVVLVSRYIDGKTTYGDLAEICPLGRLRTLQVLVEMYAPAASSVPPVRKSEPPPAESRPQLHPVAVPSRAEEPALRPVPTVSERVPAPADNGEGAGEGDGASPSEEDPTDRAYRTAFAHGTAAFVQGRFADAVQAFETCAELRPGDKAAEVMLRRARRDLELESR